MDDLNETIAEISPQNIVAVTTDNASNNNMLTKYLQHVLGLSSFCAKHGYLSCLAHVI